MGCAYEINDTLLLKREEGFPSDIFDRDRHVRNPVTLKDVENRIFHFKGKPAARAFQLDPVRVFFVERTDDDKWLVWGKVLIQSLTIEHKPVSTPNPDNAIEFMPGDWVTSGTYKISEVYDPDYQKIFTEHETPKAWTYKFKC